MSVDTNQILEEASKLGLLVAQHPAVARYKEAQQAMSADPDANRLMNDFNRQIENLSRQEASGLGITDAQRTTLENLQNQIASHIKIKAMHLAQTDFVDLLRKVNQSVQSQLTSATGAAPAGAAASPRVVM